MEAEVGSLCADDAIDDRDAPTGSDVTFFCLVPQGRPPQRADRSAAGTMPTRAFRYCEALTAASAFGWYLFPPINFSLIWDGGSDIIWTYQGADAWFPLKVAQFPHFADHFENGVMLFDYRLQPGVVRHSNALALMRAVGLEV